MSVHVRQRDIEGCSQAVDVILTRGDRLALTMRTSVAERVAAWTGATWLAQVRETADADDVIATFEATETIDGDTITVLFASDADTSGWSGSYVFDIQLSSGPLAPYTYLSGSTIYVTPDVSREVAP